MFELVSQTPSNGVAVAEARDGICTICHVRLRPQIFNTVRRNEEIIQCDSCNSASCSSFRNRAGAPACTTSPQAAPVNDLFTCARAATGRDRGVHRRRRARKSRARWLWRPHRDARTARSSRSSANRSAWRPTTSPSTAVCWRRSSGRAHIGSPAVHVRSDSQLLVQQMLGNYKVKHPGLQPLHARARLLAREIGRVTFEHVRREANKHADRLANTAMDGAAGT